MFYADVEIGDVKFCADFERIMHVPIMGIGVKGSNGQELRERMAMILEEYMK